MSNRLFTLYGANARGAFFMRETTPACPAYPGGQPMLRWRFYVPSAIVSSGEFEDLGAKDLKGIVGPCEPGQCYGRPMLRAASMVFTRAA